MNFRCIISSTCKTNTRMTECTYWKLHHLRVFILPTNEFFFFSCSIFNFMIREEIVESAVFHISQNSHNERCTWNDLIASLRFLFYLKKTKKTVDYKRELGPFITLQHLKRRTAQDYYKMCFLLAFCKLNYLLEIWQKKKKNGGEIWY